MKKAYFTGLLAALLALPGAARAQQTALAVTSPASPAALASPGLAVAASQRPTLGGPPQVAAAPAVDTAGLGAAPLLAQLRQLRLPAARLAGQAGPSAGGAALPAPEIAQAFPQAVRWQPGFLPDVAAPATATAVAGSRSLLALALAPGAAGVPSGGAAVGQRLQLRGPAGEVLVTVARPAAAGSRTLVVRGAPGLAGRPVFVVGLEHPAVQVIDYELLALLGLSAAQELVGQLTTVQQQLADLRHQLAAARRLHGKLLLDHVELQDLKEQLHHLQVQQAASFPATQRRVVGSWPID